MADLLSSASLLIAIIAVLYGLWYPDIEKGINIQAQQYRDTTRIAEVRAIMLRRALPLVVSAVGLAAVFLKDTLRILYTSLRSLHSSMSESIRNYDAVSTAFVFVEFIWIYVSIQLVGDFIQLIKKQRELKSKPEFVP